RANRHTAGRHTRRATGDTPPVEREDWQRRIMMYLGWFDERNIPITQKVRDGAAAYWQRLHVRPNVVVCNSLDFAATCEEADDLAVDGITLRSELYMVRHNFWVGVTV